MSLYVYGQIKEHCRENLCYMRLVGLKLLFFITLLSCLFYLATFNRIILGIIIIKPTMYQVLYVIISFDTFKVLQRGHYYLHFIDEPTVTFPMSLT